MQYERQIAVIQKSVDELKKSILVLKTALLKTVRVGGNFTVIKHAIYVMEGVSFNDSRPQSHLHYILIKTLLRIKRQTLL